MTRQQVSLSSQFPDATLSLASVLPSLLSEALASWQRTQAPPAFLEATVSPASMTPSWARLAATASLPFSQSHFAVPLPSQLPDVTPPPRAASHSAAVFYPVDVSLDPAQAQPEASVLSPPRHAAMVRPSRATMSQQESLASATPSAQGVPPAHSSPAPAPLDSAQRAGRPTVAAGRGCARFVNLPRT